MKKLFLSIAITFAAVSFASAQVNPHTIGLRFGGGSSFGAEFSYQHGLGETNRIEANLGFDGGDGWNALGATAMYHWDWNLTQGLNWYVGPGAGIGFYNPKDSGGKFNLGIGGQIGLEYDFSTLGAPILLSLDARPMWNFIGNTGFGWGTSLGVRYIW
ncbi:MAG: hypothetical protein ACMV0Y_05995 [Paludibacter sp.]|jgi:hypothetical protein